MSYVKLRPSERLRVGDRRSGMGSNVLVATEFRVEWSASGMERRGSVTSSLRERPIVSAANVLQRMQ